MQMKVLKSTKKWKSEREKEKNGKKETKGTRSRSKESWYARNAFEKHQIKITLCDPNGISVIGCERYLKKYVSSIMIRVVFAHICIHGLATSVRMCLYFFWHLKQHSFALFRLALSVIDFWNSPRCQFRMHLLYIKFISSPLPTKFDIHSIIISRLALFLSLPFVLA